MSLFSFYLFGCVMSVFYQVLVLQIWDGPIPCRSHLPNRDVTGKEVYFPSLKFLVDFVKDVVEIRGFVGGEGLRGKPM